MFIYSPFIWEKWQGLKISRLRLGDLLNPVAEYEKDLPKLPETRNSVLNVENVSFGYQNDAPVLDHLILEFKQVFRSSETNCPCLSAFDETHGQSF